jgi:hypothetical protein
MTANGPSASVFVGHDPHAGLQLDSNLVEKSLPCGECPSPERHAEHALLRRLPRSPEQLQRLQPRHRAIVHPLARRRASCSG